MKKAAFGLLRDMENSWWYRARAALSAKVLSRYAGNTKQKILDFGAGYGGMFDPLSRYGEVDAFEVEEEAKKECLRRGYGKVFGSKEEALSPENSHTIVALFDVIEHIGDDAGLVDSLYGVLASEGRIFITVPAFQWLWSVHDEEHSHFRRYTKKQITKLLISAGFEIEYVSYWNMLLFIPAAIIRLLGFSGKSSFGAPRWLDSLFYYLVHLEIFFIPLISLPFGTSIIVIAQKR